MSPTNDLPPTVSLRKKRYLGKIHLTCFWSFTDYKLIKCAEFNYVIALDLKLNSDWLFHYSKSSVLRDCIRAYAIQYPVTAAALGIHYYIWVYFWYTFEMNYLLHHLFTSPQYFREAKWWSWKVQDVPINLINVI